MILINGGGCKVWQSGRLDDCGNRQGENSAEDDGGRTNPIRPVRDKPPSHPHRQRATKDRSLPRRSIQAVLPHTVPNLDSEVKTLAEIRINASESGEGQCGLMAEDPNR